MVEREGGREGGRVGGRERERGRERGWREGGEREIYAIVIDADCKLMEASNFGRIPRLALKVVRRSCSHKNVHFSNVYRCGNTVLSCW